MNPATPRTLYLDTSDLSNLAKGRGRGGPERVAQQRDALGDLIVEGRVRLVVSFIHLAEMALDDEVRDRAREWLDQLSEVWCFTTPGEDVFRAELGGRSPRLAATPLTSVALDNLSVPTRLGIRVSGLSLSRLLKGASRLASQAERISRRADRRSRDDGSARTKARAADAIFAGDVSQLPRWVRPGAHALLQVAPILLDRWAGGRTLGDLSQARKLTKHGLGWVMPFVEPGPDLVAPANAQNAPACALRAAIELREAKDLNRDPTSGTHYDVRHVAFAAHCDVATLDATNYDATGTIRNALPRPKVFRSGRIDDVLEYLRSPIVLA